MAGLWGMCFIPLITLLSCHNVYTSISYIRKHIDVLHKKFSRDQLLIHVLLYQLLAIIFMLMLHSWMEFK